METKYTLDQQQVDSIKQVFKQFDTNGDGHIDNSEIGNMLEMLGRPVNQEEVDKMFKESDFDQDGKISFEEFQKIAAQQFFNNGATGGGDEDLFNQLDYDKDGFIAKDEFVKFMTSSKGGLDEAEANTRFDEVDTDKDGKVSKEELLAFIKDD